MATSPETYPKISRKLWWAMRERFKKSLPGTVTPTLVTSVVSMADASARSNVISPMRDLGLLDADNKPSKLANRWRHDDEYEAVCHEIRTNTYPNELIEAFPDADPTKKAQIQNWFMKVGHVGESAARMYADTYILVSQADPKGQEEKPTASSSARATKAAAKPEPKGTAKAAAVLAPAPDQHQERPAAAESTSHRRLPAIHIDVQVHISPDTSPEQIDRIFESMAKHLGGFTK